MRIFLLLAVLPLVSCATMTSGQYENIDVRSTPDAANAALTCEGEPAGSGVTPTTIRIRRNAGDCNLLLAKDGYEDKTILIEQGVNPAYWLNMFFSFLGPSGVFAIAGGDDSVERAVGVGILGVGFAVFATDFWTGAVHMHRPNKIDAVLEPKR